MFTERGDGAHREGSVDAEPTTELGVPGNPPEHDVGVRDRGFEPSPAVTGGPGIGPGAAGPDAEGAPAVDPTNAAATGADGMDRRRRHLAGIPGDGALEGDLRPSAFDAADIGGRAPHVEGDHAILAERRCQRSGGDCSPSRPGQEDRRGKLGGTLGADEPARRSHHRHPIRKAGIGHPLLEIGKVRGHDRLQIGIEDGGRRALELAELGCHLAGHRHLDLGCDAAEAVANRPLGLGIVKRVQQRNRRRFVLARLHPVDVAHPVIAPDQHFGAVGERVVQAGTILAPDLDDVLEPG